MKSRTILGAILGVALLSAFLAAGTVRGDRAMTEDAGLERELMLVMGEQRVIDVSEVASFSESARGVIEVKIPRDGKKMVITAVRPGRTSLLLIKKHGGQRNLLITVFARRPETIEAEINDLLGDLTGLVLRRVGPRIFIDGTVPDESALNRVERVAGLYPGQVEALAQVDPFRVRPRTNIRLDLTFIEMRKSSTWGAGVNWPGQIGATQSFNFSWDMFGGGAAATYQVVDQALPFIEAAAQAGWIKIRKRATLITTSGNRATYSSGGEVNVAVTGSQAAELRTVSYGCSLRVLPRLDPQAGLLDLEVDAEVADLAETSQDVPGRTISRVETLIHLGLGQSIILSGLDAESESRSKNGLPGLSRIPIIGMLFGVHSGRKEQVDGMIAITPTVLDNLDREGKRLLEEALKKFEKWKG